MKQQTQTNKIEWKEVEFLDCLESEASNNKLKIPKSKFLTNGKYPIIDQGEEFIAGYTNDKTKIYNKKLPVVVFGDHTRILKFVDFSFALGADGVKILVTKENINPRYLYYSIRNLNLKSLGYSRHYKLLKAKKIPLPFSNGTPNLKEQERIVSILEKAEKLKERGKNAKDLLNEYLKSVFNEMFYGKGFEEVELGNKKICLISGEYGSGASAVEYEKTKPRYIRITDIDENGNLRSELVSPSIVEKKYLLEKGDLLFARSGATVGKTYLHNKEENFQYAGYLIRFRFNSRIIPEYVYFFTKTPNYLNWISLVQRAVAQPNINARQYSSLKIPLPPLPLQQKFASIVEQIEKMKKSINKTKQNSEELFNSLMNKAFRGEL